MQFLGGKPQLGGQEQVASPVGQELSQEEMRANLQDMAGRIDESYQDFNSKKFASQNRIESKKRDALKEVFNMMLEEGIDLENPEEVKSFLDSLRERNAELYQIVESSLEKIFSITEGSPVEGQIEEGLNEEGVTPQGVEEDEMNINNENLPPNI